VVDATPVALLVARPALEILHANAAAAELFGFATHELVGATPELFTPAEEWREDLVRIPAAIESGRRSVVIEKRYRRRSGQLLWGKLRVNILRDAAGRAELLVAAVTDITELRAQAQAVAEGQRLLHAAEAAARIGAWRWDPAEDTCTVSEEWLRIHGVTEPPQNVSALRALAHPDDRSTIDAAVARALERDGRFTARIRIVRPCDDEVRHVALSGEARLDTEGGLEALVGTAQDVTELTLAEQARAESEARLQRVVEGSSDGLWEWALPATGQIWWSPSFFELLGHRPGAFAPTLERFVELLHPDDRARVLRDSEVLLEVRASFETEYRLRTKRGDYRWFQARGRVIRDAQDNPTHMSGTVHDITASRARDALQGETAERLRLITEHMPGVVFSVEVRPDGAWTVPFLSEGIRKLTGVPPDAADASTRIPALIPEDDRAQLLRAARERGEQPTTVGLTHRLLHESGEVRWVRTSATPREQEDGATLWTGVSVDVSEQIRLEEHLRHAQKMEAIGKLSGGIAHDFNNILAAILGYAELAREDAAGIPSVQESVDEIAKAGHRAKEIVAQILSFSRRTPTERRPIHLGRLVDEVGKLMRGTLPASITWQTEIEDDGSSVLADPSQLHQVLMNLCTNAFQAIRDDATTPDRVPQGSAVRVGVGRFVPSPGDPPAFAHLPEGRYVELWVQDSGPGVAPEHLDEVFEPYFTTRSRADGTGLGLATVRSIAHDHGGEVAVESTPGRGAKFRVVLPCHGGHEEVRPAPEGFRAAGQRVVLVDDEPPVRDAVSRMLERQGFAVRAFDDGPDARAYVLANPDAVDVVVTDLTMPSMFGLELAESLLERRPDLPIVLCTGFGDLQIMNRAVEIGVRAVLGKPVLADDLTRSLLEITAGPR